MKILMVSMPSLHFFRWVSQLEGAGHEVFWFDITDGGTTVNRISWVQQITGWKLKRNYPGRYFVKKYFPKLYLFVQKFNANDTAKVFEEKLKEIRPDVVHSFAMYVSCVPIFNVMQKYPHIQWVYSSWGSDLFYFKNLPSYKKAMQKVLPHIHFMFSDCLRDSNLAVELGFTGQFLGVFPGGGGFDLTLIDGFSIPFPARNTILVKGFQGRSGRAIPVVKALLTLENGLKGFKIIVFGADKEVLRFAKKSGFLSWPNVEVLGKIAHTETLKLMGKALIYIGNSNSDGIPNTLLEAICTGAFPLQSNPGGASAEIIKNGVNGLLIEDCEDVDEIKTHLQTALNSNNLLENAYRINQKTLKPALAYHSVKENVLKAYRKIEANLRRA